MKSEIITAAVSSRNIEGTCDCMDQSDIINHNIIDMNININISISINVNVNKTEIQSLKFDEYREWIWSGCNGLS